MTSIIRELWYGNIDPIGDSGTDNKKMKRSAIAMESAEKAVSEALPSTSKPLFDDDGYLPAIFSSTALSVAFSPVFSD